MVHFSNLSLEELLDPKGFDCDCGKHHETDLRVFKSGAGVISTVPEVLGTLGASYPMVVCDENTYKAAGEKVLALLAEAKIPNKLFIIPVKGEKADPDEFTVGAITMALDPACDILLAVGSGVINDCCKVVAHAAGKKHMIVATAPSMDGYASSSSSMLVNGIKTTLYNACPSGIVADTDIICQAPMKMLWAGLGDMIAKYVSVCEWRIANLVIDEYYCEEIAKLMRRSVKRIVDNADKLTDRDPAAIQAITEGLVLSGVAMAFAGTSRPASGLEHYFSHMWEMTALERGQKEPDLHGIQVGIGTYKTLRLYDWIKTISPSKEKGMEMMKHFDPKKWEAMVREIFCSAAPQILAIEKKVGKNDPVKHEKRLNRIVDNWDAILGFMRDELPETAYIAALMKKTGMPMEPADIGLTDLDTKNAYTGSREIRDKYLGCSMLWDLGLAEEARERV